jgi:hypothetical protein
MTDLPPAAQLMFDNLRGSIAHIRDGRLRASA